MDWVCFFIPALWQGATSHSNLFFPVLWDATESKSNSEIVLYQTADGKVTVNVLFARDNFWLTQRTIAELFGVNPPAISRHLKNIYASGELTREATVSKMETVQTEGGRKIAREVEFYNLDAVIAVGYRVNSIEATHFRIWATNTLREFLVKGFALNDEMLSRKTNLRTGLPGDGGLLYLIRTYDQLQPPQGKMK